MTSENGIVFLDGTGVTGSSGFGQVDGSPVQRAAPRMSGYPDAGCVTRIGSGPGSPPGAPRSRSISAEESVALTAVNVLRPAVMRGTKSCTVSPGWITSSPLESLSSIFEAEG